MDNFSLIICSNYLLCSNIYAAHYFSALKNTVISGEQFLLKGIFFLLCCNQLSLIKPVQHTIFSALLKHCDLLGAQFQLRAKSIENTNIQKYLEHRFSNSHATIHVNESEAESKDGRMTPQKHRFFFSLSKNYYLLVRQRKIYQSRIIFLA